MKKFRKIASLLLALVMVMSLCVTAYADNTGSVTTGDITITNATIGETYRAYKLFDAVYGEAYQEGNTTVIPTAYTATAEQKTALEAYSDNVFVFTANSDGTYQVTVKDGVSEEAVVSFVKSFVVELSGSATACYFPGATEEAEVTAASSTVQITGLDFGYYFVTSSLGAVISLTTTNPSASIKDKNTSEPTWDNDEPEPDDPVKSVLDKQTDASTGDVTYRDINGEKVNVGQTLTYQIGYTNTSGKVLDEVVVTDAAPDGTSYVENSIKIFFYDENGNEVAASGIVSQIIDHTDPSYSSSTIYYSLDDSAVTTTTPYENLTWTVENLPDNYTMVVEFQVVVLTSALQLTNPDKTVVNDADLVVTLGGNKYDLKTNQVENPVGEDGEPEKDVVETQADGTFDATKSINNQTVKVGDILTYTIEYEVPTPAAGETIGKLTIIDAPPAGTVYVSGSAAGKVTDGSGSTDISAIHITVASDGTITWTVNDGTDGDITLAGGETVLVYFQVTVTEAALTITDSTIENTAEVTMGTNSYTTNIVKNPVPDEDEEEPVKDVRETKADGSYGSVSIDGNKVKVDDILTYVITYTVPQPATGETLGVLTIVDAPPEGTEYVPDSAAGTVDSTSIDASHISVAGDDTITWTVNDGLSNGITLQGGETVTVTFRVKVTSDALTLTNPDKTVVNDAKVTMGENSYTTNLVKNPVGDDDEPEKDVLNEAGTSINRQSVKVGDILTYTIDYTVPAGGGDLTIVDAPPAGTTYVNGSAAGTLNGTAIDTANITVAADGTITWDLAGLSENDVVQVSFKVGVTEEALTLVDSTVENQADVTMGTNSYKTNIVKNPVPDVPKDEDFGKVIVNADGTETTVSTGSYGDTVKYDVSIDAVNSVANDAGTDADNNGVVDPVQVSAYYIYDQMDPGLTLDENSFALTINNVAYAITKDTTQSYSGVTTYTLSGKNGVTGLLFTYVDSNGYTLIEATIPWVDSTGAGLYPDCEIHLTYSATINTGAVIAGTGNWNRAIYDYSTVDNTNPTEPDPVNPTYPSGTDLNHWTYEITTQTYTYALGIQKVDADTNVPLEGAEFSAVDAGGNTIYAVDNQDGTYSYTVDTSAGTSTFITDADGQIIIKGVDIGTYTFTEGKAPKGYVLLTAPVSVTATMESSSTTYTVSSTTVTRYFDAVTAAEWDSVTTVYIKNTDGSFSEVDAKPASYADGYYKLVSSSSSSSTTESGSTEVSFDVPVYLLTVQNTAGKTLPSTGGIGTTIFYIVGSILVLGAAIILITRKRMDKDN